MAFDRFNGTCKFVCVRAKRRASCRFRGCLAIRGKISITCAYFRKRRFPVRSDQLRRGTQRRAGRSSNCYRALRNCMSIHVYSSYRNTFDELFQIRRVVIAFQHSFSINPENLAEDQQVNDSAKQIRLR